MTFGSVPLIVIDLGMGSQRVVGVIGFLGCTPASVSFLLRVAAGYPCQERHGASVADTTSVRVGMLASEGSNKVVANPSDFELAEAWCFDNIPVIWTTTAVDRGQGWGERYIVPLTKCAVATRSTEHSRLGEFDFLCVPCSF